MNFQIFGLLFFIGLYSLIAHSETACSKSFQKWSPDAKVGYRTWLRERVLNEKGDIRTEFIGMEGYARFAEQYTEGDMRKAFSQLSLVMDRPQFKKLGWQYFIGDIELYRSYKPRILNEKGEPRPEFIGMEGYARFAELHENGKMHQAFVNASAVLDKEDFKKLKWQQFQGGTDKFKFYRAKILNEKGEPRPEFIGMEGYARFAELYENGKMHRAFKNVSIFTNRITLEKLAWQAFQGTVSEFKTYRSKILNEDGSLRTEFIGMEGYAHFAEKYERGIMHRAFANVSSTLNRALFRKLNWYIFKGDVKEFRNYKSKILNKEGRFRMEFVGMEGYTRFAGQYEDGDLNKTFINASSVLEKQQFEKLGWQRFSGSIESFKSYRAKILNEKGEPKPEFIGMEGYARFAEKYEEGKMPKAFGNVSAVLDKKQFRFLRWKAFQGGTDKFKFYRAKILNEKGEPRPEFIGMEGYARFAEQYEEGKMQKAFGNVSAALDKEDFKKLKWQQFQGGTDKFKFYRAKILNEKGEPKPEFIGIEGYNRFAGQYEEEVMQRAFINASSVLEKADFEQLGWKILLGTSSQFEALVEDFVKHYPEGYQGEKGQKRVTDEIFNGNSTTAYRNMSALRDYFFGEDKDSEFQSLKWIVPKKMSYAKK